MLEFISVDVGGNYITDIHSSPINIFFICENIIYGISTSNGWGQAGTGNSAVSIYIIILYYLIIFIQSFNWHEPITAKIVKYPHMIHLGSVFSGYGHSYFVTKVDRKLYGAGNSGFGQFAKKVEENHFTPTQITHPEVIGKSVKLISSGYAYCLVVFDDETGLVFGYNESCQCGYPTPQKIFDPLPLKIPSNSPIKGLSAGKSVSLCMTNSNEIFVTGKFNNGTTYSQWTSIDLGLYNISTPIFDAYVYQHVVYLLTLGKCHIVKYRDWPLIR